MARSWVLVWTIGLVAGCAVSHDRECAAASDCGPGRRCELGRCVDEDGRTDAGDGGSSPSFDAGPIDPPRLDAGSDVVDADERCPGECASGDVDVEARSCGRCGRQTRSRTCGEGCRWDPWSPFGACTGEGECEPGEAAGCASGFDCTGCPSGCCATTGCRECNDSCTWEWAFDMPCVDVGGSCCPAASCSDAFGSCVDDGETGWETCSSMPGCVRRCTCSAGSWVECESGCVC